MAHSDSTSLDSLRAERQKAEEEVRLLREKLEEAEWNLASAEERLYIEAEKLKETIPFDGEDTLFRYNHDVY